MMNRHEHRLTALLAVLAAACLAGCAGASPRRFTRVPAGFDPSVKVLAVAALDNRSGDPKQLDPACRALVDALKRNGRCTVIEPETLADTVDAPLLATARRGDPWELLDVLRRTTNADAVLLATLTRATTLTHRVPRPGTTAPTAQSLVTRYECAVSFTARLIRVRDGVELVKPARPVGAAVVADAGEATPAQCLAQARQAAAEGLTALLLPTPDDLPVDHPPAVRLSTGLVDNDWRFVETISADAKAVLVVTLPPRFDLCRFRLTLRRADADQGLWQQSIAWTKAYDSFGWTVPVDRIARTAGPGRYLATLHAGTERFDGGVVEHCAFEITE